jgi:hypothetical protein
MIMSREQHPRKGKEKTRCMIRGIKNIKNIKKNYLW